MLEVTIEVPIEVTIELTHVDLNVINVIDVDNTLFIKYSSYSIVQCFMSEMHLM